MSRYHFTTVVSQDHFFKFLAMVSSLKANCQDFKIFVLCANDIVWHILQKISIPDVVPVMLSEVEDDKLIKAKADRIFHAFCWTLKPVFLHHVMERFTECEYFAHIDADLFFFDNPDSIFAENPEASLFLTHHRNARDFLKYYGITGVFNTGFVGCKKGATALDAVTKWKNQCIAYCPIYEDPIQKIFGDQRYVESWPQEFQGVHVARSLGVNTALWNIPNYTVSLRNGKVFVEDYPLTFYHFSGLTIISRNEFNINLYYHIDDPMVLNYIYRPYLVTLANTMREMSIYFPWFIAGFLKREYTPDTHYFVMES